MADQEQRRALLDVAKIYAPVILLVAGAFAVAFQFVDPAPPDRLVIATGSPAGAR